ncbi:hypothetical protein C7S20_08425 [Christiangramia fulva]|uniref:Capsule assembly Wzi family protein n=1 Tax=Christiangramia fulva TaxID=2126553 RepID=A0A2R3Z4X6_9FLAO|nr:hypothetical protein [Christiangramia fulva]AVR45288.1 hypothetical protein C7S20_08425 [Christiangramia fulva]
MAASFSYSQVEFSGSLNLEGYYSTKDKLPFWFYSNQRGRVSEETNFDGWISGRMNYDISSSTSLEIGGGLLYDDNFSDEIFLDELYADLKWKKLELIGGRKQKEEFYNGLSATNENFAWSLNARPLPGIQFRTSEPIYFNENEKLGLEFSWNEFLMENDRIVKGAHLHYKSLYLIYNFKNNWHLKAGITHFALWGGDSPRWGKQPEGIKDYLKIITGREGGDNSAEPDQQNVIGAHSGTYELYLTKDFIDYRLKFIYNHFFEDGTGSRYANFPDGRYGIYYENKKENTLITSAIYEFYYTRDQSDGSTAPHEHDFYFNSFSMFNNGWTYYKRIIGVPFFDYDPEIGIVAGNKFLAHHIGINGNLNLGFHNYPYKLLLSHVLKEGMYDRPYIPKRKELYFNYEMRLLQRPFNLSIQLGTEFSNVAEPIFGAGLSLSKHF